MVSMNLRRAHLSLFLPKFDPNLYKYHYYELNSKFDFLKRFPRSCVRHNG